MDSQNDRVQFSLLRVESIAVLMQCFEQIESAHRETSVKRSVERSLD